MFERIVVIGTSGSGKTTLANDLAGILGSPRVELDALHWELGWQEADKEVFCQRVDEATRGARWVLDGNYSKARDIVWPRADTIVWLNFERHVVMRRLLGRTVRRAATREELWGTGNVESWAKMLGEDSILRWAWGTYERRRRETPGLLLRATHATTIELCHPREVDGFLVTVRAVDAARREHRC